MNSGGLQASLTFRQESGNRRPTLASVGQAVSEHLDEDLVGCTVAGGYRLTGKLGRGGFGSVYSGRDEGGRSVAVKVFSRAQGLAGRADREARTASKLAHPNIHRVVGVEHDEERAYLISQLVVGERFDRTELDDEGAVRAIAAVCDALAHAHERGVIHRDVKPANILVSVEGEVTLTDFGIARDEDAVDQTLDERLLGTLSYMAPEQAAGKPATPASDVWAAALTLYARLTGKNPYRARALPELLEKLAAGAPPLAQARPDLPAELTAAVDAALRRDPRRRPTACELRDRLVAALRPAPDDDESEEPSHSAVLSLLGGQSLSGLDLDAPGVRLAARTGSALLVAWVLGYTLTVFPMYPVLWTWPLAALAGVAAWRWPRASAVGAAVVCLPAFWNYAEAAGLTFAGLAAVWAILGTRWERPRSLVPLLAVPLAAAGLGVAFAVVAATAPTARRRASEALLGGIAAVVVSGVVPSALTARLPGSNDPAGLAGALRGSPQALAMLLTIVVGALLLPPVLRGARGLRLLERTVAWAFAFGVAVCLLPQALGAAPGAVVGGAGAAMATAILASAWALVSPRLGWGS